MLQQPFVNQKPLTRVLYSEYPDECGISSWYTLFAKVKIKDIQSKNTFFKTNSNLAPLDMYSELSHV